MSEKVTITEVGPRDGLQNQSIILAVEDRVALIEAVLAAGVNRVEVGSFVSPRAVPAMADSDRVFAGVAKHSGSFSALIPNLKGYQLARDAGVKTVAMVLYASDGMAEKNVSSTRSAVEAATMEIIRQARGDGIKVVATVAVAFDCPFDGPTDPGVVEDIALRFADQGIEQLVLADTNGAANPLMVRHLTTRLVDSVGASLIGCHFHDTRAMGLANLFAALESGVRHFDASIAGLGGCPFAPGASGNVATEDVVMMLEQMGFDTGIDLSRLLESANLARELIPTACGGRARAWQERNYDGQPRSG